MAPRSKPSTRTPTRGISKTVASDPDFLPHLADLIEDGEITIGTLVPVGGVATAVESNKGGWHRALRESELDVVGPGP